MRIVVGISGASGVVLAVKLVRELYNRSIDVFTIVTENALRVFKHECGSGVRDIARYSKALYREYDMDAPISSSSFIINGMVIIPCSMNTIAKLAYGIIDNLLLRAADNQIRLKKPLILVPRETPLSRIHLRNLYRLSRIESIYILPPVLTYYHRPKTLEDMENFIIGKILDIFNIKHELYRRWGVDE